VIARALHAQRIVRRTGGIEGTCLVRSLAVWALLRKRGIVTELRIGVRKREGAIEAHAWVEREGIPLNEQAGIVSQYQIYGEPVDFDRWV
jgi:hypothetical protein